MPEYNSGDRIEMIVPYRAKGTVRGINGSMVICDFDQGGQGVRKHPDNIRPLPASNCPECERSFEIEDDYLCKECRESHT